MLDRAQELASRENEALCENLRAERGAGAEGRGPHADLQLGKHACAACSRCRWTPSGSRTKTTACAWCPDGMCLLTALPTERLLGQRLFDLPGFRINDGQIQQLLPRLESRTSLREVACQFDRPDGSVRHLRISMEPAVNAARPGARLPRRGARHHQRNPGHPAAGLHGALDSLTACPTARTSSRWWDHAVARAPQRQASGRGLVDLDRFKTVNDTVGRHGRRAAAHHGRPAAPTSARSIRSRGSGGDEFVLLLESCGGEGRGTRLQIACWLPLPSPSNCWTAPTCSPAAWAWPVPDDGNDTSTPAAPRRRRHVPGQGRGKNNNVRSRTDSLATQSARRFELETALRQAIARQELSLHYQPKVAATNGQLQGWRPCCAGIPHDYGPVGPAEFIPVAENQRPDRRDRRLGVAPGLLADARLATRAWQCRRWPSTSAHQFADNNLVTEIENALSVNQLAPQTWRWS